MAVGRKTGGRRKGTPNRLSKDAMTLLESLGCNPLEGMARIAMDKKADPALRGRMYAELAGFVYPKRRSLDVQSEQPLAVQFQQLLPSAEQLKSKLRGRTDGANPLPSLIPATAPTAEPKGGSIAACSRTPTTRNDKLDGFRPTGDFGVEPDT